MKKIVLSCFTVFSSIILFAQISIGAKGGLNITKTKNLNAAPKERYAFNVGLVAGKNISKRFFIQPELLYSSKGHSFEPPYATDPGALRLNYIALPLMLGFRADEKLSVLLGPELDYLVKCAVRFNKSVIDFTHQYPRFDAGIDLGVSYKINKKLGAELRYNYGFNTLYYTDFAGNRGVLFNGANRAFQAGVFYWLK
jgi:hypothetical protein